MENNEPKTQTQLPEAPASCTVKFKTPAGFEVLWTLRDESAKNLLFKYLAMEKHFVQQGYTPVVQGSGFKKPELPTKPCPKHNSPMKQNKNGNWYHSQGNYPNLEYCNGKGFPSEQARSQDSFNDDIPDF